MKIVVALLMLCVLATGCASPQTKRNTAAIEALQKRDVALTKLNSKRAAGILKNRNRITAIEAAQEEK